MNMDVSNAPVARGSLSAVKYIFAEILKTEAIASSETSIITKLRGVNIFQKTAFFIVTAVNTANLAARNSIHAEFC
jgi:hypothetical protein